MLWVSSRPSSCGLVWLTNRFTLEPPDIYQRVEPRMPGILAFWHGQHFLTPFIQVQGELSRQGPDFAAPRRRIQRDRRGTLGIGTIRGSGDHGSAFNRKGGVGAFKEMVRALEDNYNVALTADVPKRSRVAGLGIIMLARETGRPIMPFAMATSRFVRFEKLGPHHINLPFGRGALVGIKEINVPPDADAATMEQLRVELEETLNEATRRAYAMVGRPEGADRG